MGNFLSWLDIRQCAHFQGVVIDCIGRVAMIDKAKLALDLDCVVLVQPENVLTIAGGGDAIDDAYDFTGLDVTPGKKPLAVDRTIAYVD